MTIPAEVDMEALAYCPCCDWHGRLADALVVKYRIIQCPLCLASVLRKVDEEGVMEMLVSSTCEGCGKRWSYTAVPDRGGLALCPDCKCLKEQEKRAKEPVPDAPKSRLKGAYDLLPEAAQQRIMDHLAKLIHSGYDSLCVSIVPHNPGLDFRRAVMAIFQENGQGAEMWEYT